MMKRIAVVAMVFACVAWAGTANAAKNYTGWKADVEKKLATGDFAGAMTQLKAVEAGGDALDADYWFLLGKAESSMGNIEKSLANLDKALALEPKFAEALGHKSIVLLQKGLAKDAEAVATQAIAAEASGELYYARGAIRMAQGRFDDAIADLDAAIGMEPKNTEYFIARGEVRLRLGRYADAERDYQKAIEIDSGNAKAYLGRGGVYLMQERAGEARTDLDRCVALAPKFSSCYIRRGKLFQLQGDLDRAVSDFTKGTEYAPASEEAWFERTMAELQDNRFADAENSARSLLKVRDGAKSRKVLGMVLTARGNNAEAVAEFGKAIEKEPKDFESLYMRGNAFALQDDLDAALADFNKAIEVEKRYIEPYIAKASVYMARKDPEKALAVYGEAIAVAPKNPNLYEMRSKVYEAMGRLDESFADLKKSKELAAQLRNQQ